MLLVAAPGVVFGQLETDTLTIAASRDTMLVPDEVVFQLSVSSGQDASLEQVAAALKSAGIADAMFVSVSNPISVSLPNIFNRSLSWSFTVAVPIGKMGSEIKLLASARLALTPGGSPVPVSFNIQGIQVSEEQQAQPCSFTDLVADARAQGQKVATAAGLALGPILAISDQANPALLANFISLSRFVVYLSPSPMASCAATFKFKLLRYQ